MGGVPSVPSKDSPGAQGHLSDPFLEYLDQQALYEQGFMMVLVSA